MERYTESQSGRRFSVFLLINGKKSKDHQYKNKLEAQRGAEQVEGERLFWMQDRAYGKTNSYSLKAQQVK